MKKAGDLLSVIIDDKMPGKAKAYSKLFSAWEQLTKKHGITAAAAHSRIQDLRRGILLVEADHPGWIQILQTKEHLLLSDLQRMFSDIGITGIVLKLSKTLPENAGKETTEEETIEEAEEPDSAADYQRPALSEESLSAYDKIKDGAFKDKLKSLEESIRLNKKPKRPAKKP